MINPSDIQIDELPSVALADKGQLPKASAVYLAIDIKGAVQYVGKSVNLWHRWCGHEQTGNLRKDCRIVYLLCDKNDLSQAEVALVQHFEPVLNKVRPSSTFGLKLLRERAGLSQNQLARRMSTTVSTVAKWDQLRTFPRLYPSQMKNLMEVLSCTFEELQEAEKTWVAAKEA